MQLTTLPPHRIMFQFVIMSKQSVTVVAWTLVLHKWAGRGRLKLS
jgi:hypothetical protein